MIKIDGIRLKPSYDSTDLLKSAAKRLNIPIKNIKSYKILKKSLDARKKGDISYIISLAVEISGDCKADLSKVKNCQIYTEKGYEIPKAVYIPRKKPVIAGMGSAGLFCALTLAYAGIKPIIIERGNPTEKRVKDVEEFFERRVLNTNSNIQFGEGGAGTFSDGKLTTGTKDKRQSFVIEELIKHGAPQDIAYLNKPHIGTDKLREIIPNIRQTLIDLGCEIKFNCALNDIIIKNNRVEQIIVISNGEAEIINTNHIISAIGHSARDTVEMYYRRGIPLIAKNFACGVRIEHLQAEIDMSQYGTVADFKNLPASDYKLAYHAPDGRTAYTFCVCPGGYVIGATSEENSTVVNGMSEYMRDGINCNGALLVNVTPADFESDNPLAGIEFQRKIERAAFIAGGENYNAPVQTVADFLKDSQTTHLGSVIPTHRPGYRFALLKDILPNFITRTLKAALPVFDNKIKGFAAPDAILTGVETRSSSPVRIVRDDTYQSDIKGFYPCGEGAGYAGGIMSAAVDGIKCAQAVIESCKP